ncbi:MAG: IS110 family transposase [Aggregatilineales bacterium]
MISHYVGIDIALNSATVAWQESDKSSVTVIEIAQSRDGYQHLLHNLKQLAPVSQIQIVMEATSTYWMDLAYVLYDAGFQVSVVNPSQPKYFAQMRLQRAKTDAIDAVMLMDYAQSQQPDLWTPPPAICEQLRQYLTYRQQLIEMQTQVRNQHHALKQNPNADTGILARMTHRLSALSAEIKQLAKDIDHLLHTDHDWAVAVDCLMSIPGISTISTAWLLVATHGFERCDTPEQAVAFAGLAPHPQQSGSSKNSYRSIGGSGHQALRNTLYMASAPASRFNPILKPYYEKLLARGKAKKVARCAVARKLIHIAWACVTKQRLFDPNFQQQLQVA